MPGLPGGEDKPNWKWIALIVGGSGVLMGSSIGLESVWPPLAFLPSTLFFCALLVMCAWTAISGRRPSQIPSERLASYILLMAMMALTAAAFAALTACTGILVAVGQHRPKPPSVSVWQYHQDVFYVTPGQLLVWRSLELTLIIASLSTIGAGWVWWSGNKLPQHRTSSED